MIWAILGLAWGIDGEGERLAEEMLRYAADGKWPAVEAQYVRLIANHPTEVTGELHRLGAQSARLDGELLLAAQRLQRVLPSSPDYDAVERDLSALKQNTGLVMVSVKDRDSFSPVTMPFNPELRVSVQHAVADIKEAGLFVGLLPVGDYSLDGTTLKVNAGFHWQVLSIQ